ncbi:epoxide hydrolase family protein [Sorangium sp. So ce302]|uniref:epoxide hydrolase family protein n=1 Tax=Sorangium sp. So ce302 TaxID=3133297 RepID=UPI003F619F0C
MHRDSEIHPFRIDIPQADIDDLRERLARTRWPAQLPGGDWVRGVPVAYLQRLAAHWQRQYDWRRCEAHWNSRPQFTTRIDGQTIHFVHLRSPEPDAQPLLLLHGWPGSFAEFDRVVDALSDPRRHGCDPSQAFHLVIPSIPGHGFSMPLADAGWNHGRCARALAALMQRLGYTRYGVQGGDVGAFIAAELGRIDSEHVRGVHCNALVTFPSGDPAELEGLTASEQQRLERLQNFRDRMMGFAHIQGTRPQTLSYGLHDSPVGQLAWIVEKFKEWTDPAAALPEDAVGLDALLDNVSLYWFTGTSGPSANLYYEAFNDPSGWAPKPRGTVPMAVAVSLTQDVAVRRLAERDHHIVRWTELARGGHFLATETPTALAADLREFFGSLS